MLLVESSEHGKVVTIIIIRSGRKNERWEGQGAGTMPESETEHHLPFPHLQALSGNPSCQSYSSMAGFVRWSGYLWISCSTSPAQPHWREGSEYYDTTISCWPRSKQLWLTELIKARPTSTILKHSKLKVLQYSNNWRAYRVYKKQ